MLALFLLPLVSLIAGFVDAIAGGGGLLTLPSLLVAGLPPQAALATNKGQSVFGSGMALLRFYHSPLLDTKRMLPTFPATFVGALVGAQLLTLFPAKHLTPVVMVMLVAVVVFMIFYKPPHPHAPRTMQSAGRRAMLAAIIGGVIGCYDGFFGPGTGTCLILAYATLLGDQLDAASANAKIANFASNLAALFLFWSKGLILWKIALPMAAGQAVGGWMGAHVTVRRGRGLVRAMTIIMSLALLGTLVWRWLR
jgi:uncharacterized membrane protein YfcA